MFANNVALTLALLTVAEAQAETTQDVEAAPSRNPHSLMGAGGAFAFGTTNDGGWIGRLEIEGDMVMTPSTPVGALFGQIAGIEVWTNGPNYSVAVPYGFVLGIRVLPVRITIGFGADAVSVARIADDTGIGSSGFGSANLGLDIYGFRIAAEGRVSHRILLGAPDYTQYQLTAFVGRSWEVASQGRSGTLSTKNPQPREPPTAWRRPTL